MSTCTDENRVNGNRIVTAVLSIVLGVSGEMNLRAQSPCPDPPDYQVLRQNEDHSYLRDDACKLDRWDSVKYVRLGSRSDSYLTIGGEAREWYEGFRNYNWGLSPPGTQRAHLTRARKNQLAFLDAFASIGTVRGAAAALGIHRRTHYKWIDTNPDYQAAFEEAREDLRDLIREEVRRRAIDGWGEPIVYRGEIARDSKGRPLTITKYSDRMLELLAKATCPEYRDKHEITGAGSEPLAISVVTGVPQPGNEDGR
jgi:hypothetical protein